MKPWHRVLLGALLACLLTDAAQGRFRMTEPERKDAKPIEFTIRRATTDSKLKLCYANATQILLPQFWCGCVTNLTAQPA